MVEYHYKDGSTFDELLIALADQTRRAILMDLRSGEKRVTELAKPFSMSLNSVSKHIKKLEHAGLVRRRRDGRDHFLSANPQPIDEMAKWFDAQRQFWNTRLDRLEALVREEAENE